MTRSLRWVSITPSRAGWYSCSASVPSICSARCFACCWNESELHNPMISQKFILTSVLLVATMATAKFTERRNPAALVVPLGTISSQLAGWSATADEKLPDRVEGTLAASSYLTRGYRRGKDELNLFIAFYEQQRAGESMHSPKHCLPGGGWEIWDYGSAQVPVGRQQVKINKYFIQHPGQREPEPIHS